VGVRVNSGVEVSSGLGLGSFVTVSVGELVGGMSVESIGVGTGLQPPERAWAIVAKTTPTLVPTCN
jgi:hypothetical protein